METNPQQSGNIIDRAVDTLVSALQRGHSETLKTYLSTIARFHRFSWNNALLIQHQCPHATHVAGFRTWQTLGRQIIKGSKGIMIFAPVFYKKAANSSTADDEAEEVIRSFRTVYVFDISQTQGKPLPDLGRVRGDAGTHLERLCKFVSSRGIVLEYGPMPDGIEGMSSKEGIKIGSNMALAQEFSVIVHEYAHQKLHLCSPEMMCTSKKVLETEAEAVAFVVCEAIGLDTNTSSADYIHLYRGDKETLMASLDRIQKTAAEIIHAITEAPDTKNDHRLE
jgi:hypothetical protein